MTSRTLMLLASAAVLGLSAPVQASDLPTACAAPLGERPALSGIDVEAVPAQPGDLPVLKVTTQATGAWMKVHYDAGSEAAAWSRAVCLGAQIEELTRDLGDVRRDAEWFSVVFTQDPAYVAPRGPGVKARWSIQVGADGNLPELSQHLVRAVMPHEQVHDYQRRAEARLPRWFAEGHATWVGLRVTGAIDAGVAESEREKRAAARAEATAPLNLAAWGSVRPRREAIMRQVSAEDRARMQADPNFNPGGTFRFTTADFEGDESDMPARYGAALAVFDGLEARHGAEAVRAWVTEVTAATGPVSPESMAASVQAHFGEALEDLLRDP